MDVVQKAIKILNKKYREKLEEYYGFSSEDDISVETIAIKKGWILKGAQPDLTRTSQIILSTFRDGKIGKFTLETPEEYELI